jgi:hypothetical protein
MQERVPSYTFAPDSEAARILEASVHWPASEWMALSQDRRRFLFQHAIAYTGPSPELDAIAIGIIDSLIDQGEGEEIERWLGLRNAESEPVWAGTRGQRLLALDKESGFRERGVIALHRGVRQLEQGDLPGALRSMAYALQHAPESRAADALHALSLRWLTHIAAQFQIGDELLVTLQELVPRREYGVILEDLLWRAALRADGPSFQRGVERQVGRGALSRRIDLLAPLADGNGGRFSSRIREGLAASPSETLRFLDQMVQRLELEEAAVRSAHLPTLVRVRALVLPMADPNKSGGQTRRASALLDRTLAIADGLGGLGDQASSRDRASALDPSGEVFAGAIRLAPSDPLPWPFRATDTPAPSVFTPIALTPIEWLGDTGSWVFGWTLSG